MNITSAKYYKRDGKNIAIQITVNPEPHEQKFSVPISEDNYHYKEIMEKVAAGTLTIAPADTE
tara:strand:- start:252 stop:440 length:189 start_codon:yes stop_codon:yes gene_type:complete